MTDKITFTSNGERHELPIDSIKTLRVGDISPETKLTVDERYSDKVIRGPEFSEWRCYLFGNKPGGSGLAWRPLKGKEPNWFWRTMQYLVFGNLWVKIND